MTLILKNGKLTTLDPARANASAVAIGNGRFTAVGDDAEIMKLAGPRTEVKELADFQGWAKIVKPGQGNDMYRHNGAGEMLVYSAADFEDFREPRPDMPPNIDRIRGLGGGIAVQHHMAYQGEDFARRYGREMTAEAPPVKRTWFSNEEGRKGAIRVGQLADLAVLSADYVDVPEGEIKDLVSMLTIVGGNVVYGDGPFSMLAPPLPPASPDWSPVNGFGGYHRKDSPESAMGMNKAAAACCSVHGSRAHAWVADLPVSDRKVFWDAMGCNCWMA